MPQANRIIIPADGTYLWTRRVVPDFATMTVMARVQPLAANANFTIWDLIPSADGDALSTFTLVGFTNDDFTGPIFGSSDHANPGGSHPSDPYHSFMWFGIRNGKLSAEYFDGRNTGWVTNTGSGVNEIITATANLSTGRCSLCAFRMDWPNTTGATGTMSILVDGVVVASVALPAQNSSGWSAWQRDTSGFAIGQCQDPGYCDNNVSVAMQEFAYSQNALSDASILALVGQDPFPAQTLTWRLDGNSNLLPTSGATSHELNVDGGTLSEGTGCYAQVEPNVSNLTDPEGTQPPSSSTLGTCCEAPGAPLGVQEPTPGEVPPAVGWTPECTPGTGTLPSEPAATNTSMVGVIDPRGFLSVGFKTFNADNTVIEDEIRAFTTSQTINDAPTYEDGRKPGVITQVSSIIRGMSDDEGNFQGSSLSVTLSDKDKKVLRERLGDPTRQHILSREGRFSLYNEAIRDTQGAAQRLFRGLNIGHDLAENFNAMLKFEDIITAQIGRFGPDKGYSTRRFPKVMWPFAIDLAQKPVQYIFGEVSDAGAVAQTAAGGDGAKGMVPLWLMGARMYNDILYDEYHLAGHACKDFRIYGTDNAEERPKRVLLDLDALGAAGDVLAPGFTGWPLAEKYLDILNPSDQGGDGLIHRVTHIFIRSTHYLTDAHKRGSVTLAANVCGIEDQGDGEGELITDMFIQQQFIWEQIICPVQEWTTGLYAPAPRWEDNTLMVDSESFATAQARTATAIGGRGYQGAGVMCGPADGALGVRELMRRMTQSSGARFSWSGVGQLKCVWTDPEDIDAIDAAREYTEPSGIRAWPSPSYPEDLVCNHMYAEYDYDDDAKRFRAEYNYRDNISIGRIGYRPSRSSRAMRFCRDKTTAEHVVQRQVYFRRYPPTMVPVVAPVKLGATDHNPGDFIRIRSWEGPWTNDPSLFGFNHELLEIQNTEYIDSNKTVKMMCRALGAASIGDVPLFPNADAHAPFASVLDSAIRADESPLDNNGQWDEATAWYGGPGLQIVSNKIRTLPGAGPDYYGGSLWTQQFNVPGGPFITVDAMPSASNDNYFEIVLLQQDPRVVTVNPNYYSAYVMYTGGTWYLHIAKRVGAVATEPYVQPIDFASGDKLQVIKTADLLKVYVYDASTQTSRFAAAIADDTHSGPFWAFVGAWDQNGTPGLLRMSNFGISPTNVVADDQLLLIEEGESGVMRLF